MGTSLQPPHTHIHIHICLRQCRSQKSAQKVILDTYPDSYTRPTHFPQLSRPGVIRPPFGPLCLLHLYLCPPSASLLPPSLLASLIRVPLLFSTVPIQLAEQQHGEPGEPRDVRQPLQLRERLLIGRAHPLTILPAQLHLRGPVACPGHPLQHRLPRSSRLPGVLPAV